MSGMEITPALICDLISYDAETGVLTWKPRRPEHFKGNQQPPEHSCKIWNNKYAGEVALSCLNKNGYFHGAIFGTTVTAHKAAWAISTGEWPENTIDHIDGVKTNNRIANLRDVPIAVNSKNQRRNSRNTSGITGVHLHKPTGRWVASIKGKGKVRNLGYFPSKEEAAQARLSASKKFGFHPNHGRAA